MAHPILLLPGCRPKGDHTRGLYIVELCFLFLFFPILFIIFTLLFSLPPINSRSSDPGVRYYSRLFLLPPPPTTVLAFFFYRGKTSTLFFPCRLVWTPMVDDRFDARGRHCLIAPPPPPLASPTRGVALPPRQAAYARRAPISVPFLFLFWSFSC